MCNRILIIPFLFFLISFIPIDKSIAQPTLGIKAGLVYMTNEKDFSDNLGYSTGMSFYFLNVKGIELGVEASYARKGYRYIVWTYSDEIQSPLEFISVSIPIKNNQSISDSFDLFFIAGIRADLLLTDSKSFYSPVTGDGSSLNSTIGYTLGAGVTFKKIDPNLFFEISVNPDLTDFTHEVRNTSLELKTGILFNGFKSK